MSSNGITNLPIPYRRALNIGKQSRAGALGLLAYDHFITLDREIELIWRQDKNRQGFWLFVFNRFFPLLWLIFDTIPLARSGIVSSKICIIYLMCDDIVTLLITISVQSILQLRVYALYGRSRRMLIFLVCCCTVEIAIMAILVGVTMRKISHLPVVSTPTGCYYSGIFSLSALFWIPILIFEPILCLLILWKAWGEEIMYRFGLGLREFDGRPKATSTPRMVKLIARDSLMYFLAIFVELLINTIIWAKFNRYINIVMPWSCALPSIFGSRLLLNMREMVLDKGDHNSYILETFAVAEGQMEHMDASSSITMDAPRRDRNSIGVDSAGE